MKVRPLPYIITMLWAGLIFLGSSIQGPDLPDQPSVVSWLTHFFEYTVLGTGLGFCVIASKKTGSGRAARVAFFIGLAFALSDEAHQLFVPGRQFDPFDLLIDGMGLVVGLFVIALRTKNISFDK